MQKLNPKDLPFANGSRSLCLQRGVGRLLSKLGFSFLTEFTLPSGRRADVIGVNAKGEILIVEIKSSKQDFESDHKWHFYLDHCDFFAFATSADLPSTLFPPDHGLIYADEFGAEVFRDPSVARLSASTRKAITLSFARQAAHRLIACLDPAIHERSVD